MHSVYIPYGCIIYCSCTHFQTSDTNGHLIGMTKLLMFEVEESKRPKKQYHTLIMYVLLAIGWTLAEWYDPSLVRDRPRVWSPGVDRQLCSMTLAWTQNLQNQQLANSSPLKLLCVRRTKASAFLLQDRTRQTNPGMAIKTSRGDPLGVKLRSSGTNLSDSASSISVGHPGNCSYSCG